MTDNDTILKEELNSIYQKLKNAFLKNSNNESEGKDIQSNSTLSIIKNINEFINLIIPLDVELNQKYSQLENHCKKLENDLKFYIKKHFQNKIQKDVLEMKLQAYMGLEEEYDDLKQKVKYEGGKFLDNDRKDNEIIILRRENSKLKKEIANLENINKSMENKNKEYQSKIDGLQKNVEILNNKIYNLEAEIKLINSYSMNQPSNDNTIDKNNNNCYYNLKTLKKMCPQNLNNFNRKILNFHSPKNNFAYLDHSKITANNSSNKTINNINNNNIFTFTYNRIVNGTNKNKLRIPIKNEFNTIKNHRNNSMQAIRFEEDEKRSESMNKIMNNNNNNKSGNHTINLIKILNYNKSNSGFISPLSCKNHG